ncbi:MAG TPA: TonB family protein [Gammaproteobacteria bacterium]|nr:TonB family protein [Gammaproteobacteria bacterium]
MEQARKKAASSGLLALSNELADLRRSPLAALLPKKPLIQVTDAPSGPKRSLITSRAGSGSGGIDTSTLSTDVGETTLASRATTVVESEALLEEESAKPVAREGRKAQRSVEQIQLVLDQNKGAIYALYHRALRRDPTLQGKVVLDITIDPPGNVSACKVVSSELKAPRLQRKLCSRIKLFQFGAQEVETMVFTWPIDFLPTS